MLTTANRALFALYLAVLVWVLLFKLHLDLSVILERSRRSINLVPFPGYGESGAYMRDIAFNVVFFIPFGVLLMAGFKELRFPLKLLAILAFSVAVETIQFVFGIGASDTTDVLTNTAGGVIGLFAYGLAAHPLGETRLDRAVLVTGSVMFVLFIAAYFAGSFRGYDPASF